MSEKDLVFPVVNLNGTSKAELIQQMYGAYDAIRFAEVQLKAMTPHGRDYQTVGFEQYSTARDQHMDRLQKLAVIKDELERMLEHIQK